MAILILTKGQEVVLDMEDLDMVKDMKWYLGRNGYAK